MTRRLKRWSGRLERAALAFARSWAQDGEARSAAPVAAPDRPGPAAGASLGDGPGPADAAWSAQGESPPAEWLRYVAARSQAPDGSRAYAPRASAARASATPIASAQRPLRAARQLAAWARARVPGARSAVASTPPKAVPASVAAEPGEPRAPRDGVAPSDAGSPPPMQAVAVPRVPARPGTPRPRPAPSPGAAAREESAEAHVAPDALAAARPLPVEPRRSSRPPSAEPGQPTRARLRPRAEPEGSSGPPGAPAVSRESEAPSAPASSHHAASPAPGAAPPAPTPDPRALADAAAWQGDLPPHPASRPRSPERAEPRPPLRAPTRLARVEVTELAPRLRLRVSPELARAEPTARAFDPSRARLPGVAAERARLQARDADRAEAPASAGVPSHEPPADSQTIPRGAAPPARAVTPSPARAHFERPASIATDRSLIETDRSRAHDGCRSAPTPAVYPELERAARRDGAHPSGRFPELPRRDGAAAAPRAAVGAWPELPPSLADTAPAHPLERCDQLLREQSEV